jgi:FkbM family methyltransferase
MKHYGGMYYPDGEEHMIDWLKKNGASVDVAAPGEPADVRVIYQWKKQAAVYAACKQRRAAIDIGAHVGTWSVNMRRLFSRVHAFEPVEAHRECFAANVPASDRLTLHPLACGAASKFVSITRDPNNSGASHVGGAGEIEMVPLDAFGFDDVDLIKMDVEGYEANVIAGARETILRCRPIVCAEQKRDFAVKFGLKPTAATDALRGLGMKLIQEIGGDFIFGW